MKATKMIYLPVWYLKNVVLGGRGPLQTVIAITDCCNLSCRHCAVSVHACTTMKPFEQIKEELLAAYRAGSRFVDFEGGEPVLWKDGEHTLNDLYHLAHDIGFFHCTLTTNGQQPFGDIKADFVWVSVDGNQTCHDNVRGEGTFRTLDRNIRESKVKNLAINMVIHKKNVSSVTETIRYAKENPAICAISLNFLTPYPGTEDLLLPWKTRRNVIDRIIEMKRAGYPIINSYSGLKGMKERRPHHNCWVSHFILLDGTWKECPGKELGICMDCGFCMAGEMDGVVRLRPDTILVGLKLRNSWWKNKTDKGNVVRGR